MGIEASAKDFRTWHATVIAAAALAETDEPGKTKASRKRAVSSAMKEVSDFLGNTPTLARSSYVDPRVVEAYERGRTIKVRAQLRHRRRAPGRPRAGGAQAPRRLSPLSCGATTWSIAAVSFSTSEGSIAGYIAMRSWLRPSLR